jgi:hypothetical protein
MYYFPVFALLPAPAFVLIDKLPLEPALLGAFTRNNHARRQPNQQRSQYSQGELEHNEYQTDERNAYHGDCHRSDQQKQVPGAHYPLKEF